MESHPHQNTDRRGEVKSIEELRAEKANKPDPIVEIVDCRFGFMVRGESGWGTLVPYKLNFKPEIGMPILVSEYDKRFGGSHIYVGAVEI